MNQPRDLEHGKKYDREVKAREQSEQVPKRGFQHTSEPAESTENSIAATEIKVRYVIKRDGRTAEFSLNKIVESIFLAAKSVGGRDRELSVQLAHEVLQRLNRELGGETVSSERLQELVERILIENGHVRTAKAYILFYHRKNEERKRRALIFGREQSEENLLFSDQALQILERRYLLKDSQGNPTETPKKMLQRVAHNLAKADFSYGADEEEVRQTERSFYGIMAELKFLPNSPTLMNAETKTQQLGSCFVLPVEDRMESIFGSLHDAAVIHQRGSGTGFSFSRLRPKGDSVRRNLGVAAGPVAFMNVYDAALDVIKQGGIRPGANMAVLRVDHPDILRFIEAKREKKSLKNFNISVAVTDDFMEAVENDKPYIIRNPKTGKEVGLLQARDVFSVITQNAWKTGDPGLIFIDEINRKHPAKHLGRIETTNQCGEAPLLPYEGCVLGSINLNKFVDEENLVLDWDGLKETIRISVHLLDNVIDMNSYPKQEIKEQTKKTRKFGLGIMGLADMLCQLKIKYNSDKGLEMADTLMSFIKDTAYRRSQELGEKRGPCPAWQNSDHQFTGRKMRNISCISISPTGTISILANASSGCEPLFAISYQRTVLGDSEIVYLNKAFEKIAKEQGFYTPELIRKVSRSGSIQNIEEIPVEIRDVFVTSQDISPEWHIKMQATLQKHVDNSISKTINFPSNATIKEIENAYLLAWKAKCKGITIYRDGSYEEQVINLGNS